MDSCLALARPRRRRSPTSRRLAWYVMDVDMQDDMRGGRGGARRTPLLRRRGAANHSRELGIKGSSGQTMVVVANLAKGTTLEDVRTTFEQFGRIVNVKEYRMPNLAKNALAYKVLFSNRAAAMSACQKYDGMHSDGHMLKVQVISDEPETPAPAPAPPRPKKKGPSTTPRLEEEQLPLPVLRRLAQAEAKYLAETERILREKDTPATAAQATKATSLLSRIGSAPLAQRLAAPTPQSAAEKMAKSPAAAKRHRARQRRAARAKKAGGVRAMDVE